MSKSGGKTRLNIDEHVQQLSPEQAELFLRALELALKKRRIMIAGYLAALFAILIGLVGALYIYASSAPAQFLSWVFLIPFLLAGILIFGFGRLAKRIKK